MTEFDLDGDGFEGLPLCTALAMAVMEQSGVRKLIDGTVVGYQKSKGHVPLVNLSEGMACKAMLGTMFTSSMRMPLYEIGNFYAEAPKKELFGPFVGDKGLSDTIFAKRMDTIYDAHRNWKDFNSLLWEANVLVCRTFGLNSEDYFLDGTDIDLWGASYKDNGDGAALPKHHGKPKSGKKGLLHKSIMVAVRGCTVLCYAQAYDGATSDMTMDNDAIRSLIKRVDISKAVFTMDCKGCTLPNLALCVNGGVGVVTKVPEKFCDGLREDVIFSANTGMLDESPKRPGRFYYDTHAHIVSEEDGLDADMRVIAYRLPNGIRRAEKYLRTRAKCKLDKAMRALSHKRFSTMDDAERAFEEVLGSADQPIFDVSRRIFEDEVRKRKGEPCWRIKSEPAEIRETDLREACERQSLNVLITNLPFAVESCDDPRRGSSTDDVIEYYLRQCIVERRFRMMKTCHGVGHVYIHTLRRQDVMIFITALATMIQSAMDEKLRITHTKGKRRITMERAADILGGARLGFDRGNNRVYVSGSRESAMVFSDIIERLEVRKELLFGF